jgi:large subunit ribosomal protein LX
MGEVKTFRVSGRITKPNFRTNFSKELKALKPEDAVEEVLKTLGSKHKVKRFYIKVEKVEEVSSEEPKQ